jgi:hypothetical protein
MKDTLRKAIEDAERKQRIKLNQASPEDFDAERRQHELFAVRTVAMVLSAVSNNQIKVPRGGEAEDELARTFAVDGKPFSLAVYDGAVVLTANSKVIAQVPLDDALGSGEPFLVAIGRYLKEQG